MHLTPINSRYFSITYILIAMNVLIFLLLFFVNESIKEQAKLHYFEHQDFYFFQYLSSAFVHNGLLHLAFNSLGLFVLGARLEKYWGKFKFIVFYILCALGSGFIHHVVIYFQLNQAIQQLLDLGVSNEFIDLMLHTGRDISVDFPGVSREIIQLMYNDFHSSILGASGAIYGLLVAYAIWYPNDKVVFLFLPYPIAAKYFIPMLLLIDLSFGISGHNLFGLNVAHFAHIGGALVGGFLTYVFLHPKKTLRVL